MQELIFQNKQLKYVTSLDSVHNSDSLNAITSVRKISCLCFKVYLKAQNESVLITDKLKIDHLSQVGSFPRACHKS